MEVSGYACGDVRAGNVLGVAHMSPTSAQLRLRELGGPFSRADAAGGRDMDWRADKSLADSVFLSSSAASDCDGEETGDRFRVRLQWALFAVFAVLCFAGLLALRRNTGLGARQPVKFRTPEHMAVHSVVLLGAMLLLVLHLTSGMYAYCWIFTAYLSFAACAVLWYEVTKATQLVYLYSWNDAKRRSDRVAVRWYYKHQYMVSPHLYLGGLVFFLVFCLGVTLWSSVGGGVHFYENTFETARCYWWQIPAQFQAPTSNSTLCPCYTQLYTANAARVEAAAPVCGAALENACTLAATDPDLALNRTALQDDPDMLVTLCKACNTSATETHSAKQCRETMLDFLSENTPCGYPTEMPALATCNSCPMAHRPSLYLIGLVSSILVVTLVALVVHARHMDDKLLLRFEATWFLLTAAPVHALVVVTLLLPRFSIAQVAAHPSYTPTTMLLWAFVVLAWVDSIVLPLVVATIWWHQESQQLQYADDPLTSKTSGSNNAEKHSPTSAASDRSRARRKSSLFGGGRPASNESRAGVRLSQGDDLGVLRIRDVIANTKNAFERELLFALEDPAAGEVYKTFSWKEFTIESFRFLEAGRLALLRAEKDSRGAYPVAEESIADEHGVPTVHAPIAVHLQYIVDVFLRSGAPLEVNISAVHRSQASATILGALNGANPNSPGLNSPAGSSVTPGAGVQIVSLSDRIRQHIDRLPSAASTSETLVPQEQRLRRTALAALDDDDDEVEGDEEMSEPRSLSVQPTHVPFATATATTTTTAAATHMEAASRGLSLPITLPSDYPATTLQLPELSSTRAHEAESHGCGSTDGRGDPEDDLVSPYRLLAREFSKARWKSSAQAAFTMPAQGGTPRSADAEGSEDGGIESGLETPGVLPAFSKQAIMRHAKNRSSRLTPEDTFRAMLELARAMREIKDMLIRDSWPRFRASAEYAEFRSRFQEEDVLRRRGSGLIRHSIGGDDEAEKIMALSTAFGGGNDGLSSPSRRDPRAPRAARHTCSPDLLQHAAANAASGVGASQRSPLDAMLSRRSNSGNSMAAQPASLATSPSLSRIPQRDSGSSIDNTSMNSTDQRRRTASSNAPMLTHSSSLSLPLSVPTGGSGAVADPQRDSFGSNYSSSQRHSSEPVPMMVGSHTLEDGQAGGGESNTQLSGIGTNMRDRRYSKDVQKAAREATGPEEAAAPAPQPADGAGAADAAGDVPPAAEDVPTDEVGSPTSPNLPRVRRGSLFSNRPDLDSLNLGRGHASARNIQAAMHRGTSARRDRRAARYLQVDRKLQNYKQWTSASAALASANTEMRLHKNTQVTAQAAVASANRMAADCAASTASAALERTQAHSLREMQKRMSQDMTRSAHSASATAMGTTPVVPGYRAARSMLASTPAAIGRRGSAPDSPIMSPTLFGSAGNMDNASDDDRAGVGGLTNSQQASGHNRGQAASGGGRGGSDVDGAFVDALFQQIDLFLDNSETTL